MMKTWHAQNSGNQRKPPRGHERGFLLIEVLFAAALLALVIAVIAGSFSASYRALSSSHKATRAGLLLESKISELHARGVAAPDSGGFSENQGQYTWRAEPAGDCADSLCPVTIFVEWEHRGATHDVRATTLLPRPRPSTAEANP